MEGGTGAVMQVVIDRGDDMRRFMGAAIEELTQAVTYAVKKTVDEMRDGG